MGNVFSPEGGRKGNAFPVEMHKNTEVMRGVPKQLVVKNE